MIVRCTECNAAYSVEDKKIENKKFGFSCPKCGSSVIIDNRLKRDTLTPGLELAEEYITDEKPGRKKDDDFSLPGGDDLTGIEEAVKGAEELLEENDAVAFREEPLESLDDIDAMLASKGTTEAEGELTDDIDLGSLDDVLEPKSSDEDEHEESAEDEPLIIDDFESGISLDTVEVEGAGQNLDDDISGDDESLKLDDFESGLDNEIAASDSDTAGKQSDILAELEDIEIPEEEGKAELVSVKGRKAAAHEEDIDFDQIIMEEDLPDKKKNAVKAGARGSERNIKTDEVFSKTTTDLDESLTIDLDTLDIELEETDGIVSPGLDDVPDIDIDEIHDNETPADDETNTTIDLDSLDISLEEEEGLKRGIELDDDERLSLDDAGLSLEELGPEEVSAEGTDDVFVETADEEDIKLNLKEIDPSLSLEALSDDGEQSERLITEDFEEDKLPEIDLEGLDESELTVYKPPIGEDDERLTSLIDEKHASAVSDDFLDIETREEFARYQAEIEGEERGLGDVVPGGCLNFSVDYSLTHSRIGALLRLTGLFAIALIPRLLVFIVYSVVTWAVSMLNWLLILLTGSAQDDYSEMQEKTLRIAISLGACQAGTVEDMPLYTGGKNIDYPLQINVIYPVRYSRVLAFLRLTGVGMIIILLPHLLLLTLLTLGAVLIYIAGQLSVLAVKRWPNLLFDFMSRYFGYLGNVLAFAIGLIDRYPSFRFE